MDKRRINQLYQLLLNNWKNNPVLGVCAQIHALSEKNVSRSEILYLTRDFLQRKPKWYNSLFWWNKNFNKKGIQSWKKDFYANFWWSLNDEGFVQRKKFIQKLIKKTS